jgi:hypothetical protein
MLLGLVVLVVGAGVIGASGAFSSVQADRTISMNVEGDSAALLGLEPLDSAVAGTESAEGSEVAILTINNQSLNERARTEFGNAFRVTNNGQQNIDQFYIRENTSASAPIQEGGPIDFLAEDGDSIVGGSDVSLGATGGSQNITVVVDLRGQYTGADLPESGTITLVANDTANVVSNQN